MACRDWVYSFESQFIEADSQALLPEDVDNEPIDTKWVRQALYSREQLYIFTFLSACRPSRPSHCFLLLHAQLSGHPRKSVPQCLWFTLRHSSHD